MAAKGLGTFPLTYSYWYRSVSIANRATTRGPTFNSDIDRTFRAAALSRLPAVAPGYLSRRF
jgi:hypothetical protein